MLVTRRNGLKRMVEETKKFFNTVKLEVSKEKNSN